MTVLTDLGDAAVLLPLATAVLLWLLAERQTKASLGWALAVVFCVGVTALLKIYFAGCVLSSAPQGPSGHTSFSMLVYGGVALVSAAQSTGWRRRLALAGAIGLIGGIAISRIVLGAHGALEIALGMVIGSIALAVFAWAYFNGEPAELSLQSLVVILVLLGALLNGQELHTEEMLHAVGRYFHFDGMACV